MRALVAGSEEGGYVPLGPVVAEGLGSRAEIEAELDQIVAAIRTWHARQPDEVLREVAAYSARCTELGIQLVRVEGRDRSYAKLRTLQLERFVLPELERQWRLASRQIEMRRQDLELLK